MKDPKGAAYAALVDKIDRYRDEQKEARMARLETLQKDAEHVGMYADKHGGTVKIGLMSDQFTFKDGKRELLGRNPTYFGMRECWRGSIKEAEAFVLGAQYGMGYARAVDGRK